MASLNTGVPSNNDLISDEVMDAHFPEIQSDILMGADEFDIRQQLSQTPIGASTHHLPLNEVIDLLSIETD